MLMKQRRQQWRTLIPALDEMNRIMIRFLKSKKGQSESSQTQE
jgi:hypothetical protein